MRVAIGADHAGFQLKQVISEHLRPAGHTIIDVGTVSDAPVDYPDYAEALAKVIVEGKAERGVLICGSGVGASVAANKIPGIRAGLCHDSYSARQGVEHRVIGSALAKELVDCFLGSQFSREERHQRRVGKIKALEQRYQKS
jgi:ribose 5-phosphate isomerase B